VVFLLIAPLARGSIDEHEKAVNAKQADGESHEATIPWVPFNISGFVEEGQALF
jgi:hypothetical protein